MVNLKELFLERFPGTFFLEKDHPDLLNQYLKKQGWLSADDQVKFLAIPGEGNMNFVLRVVPVKGRSFIIKQARPWVEKYPQVAAPVERIQVEKTYYASIQENDFIAQYSPRFLGYDTQSFILALEDLGQAADFSFVYQKAQTFKTDQIKKAINYLNALQKIEPLINYPENLPLRNLNHQHIFHLPFLMDNGFDLDAVDFGLQKISEKYKRDEDLKKRINILGNIYLSSGGTMLHGDFYPGSLLNVDGALFVIDPEFSFIGPTEWDISIFIAHLFMAQISQDEIQTAFHLFAKKSSFLSSVFTGFTGVEILRRLIGLAQLPLEMDLTEKEALMDQAVHWIKTGKIDTLNL